MRVPVIDPPEDAESVREKLHEVRYRLGVCFGSYVAAFLLVSVPIPYLTDVSTIQMVFIWVFPRIPDYVLTPPGEGFRAYVQVTSLVALTLDQPVIIYQLLALVAAPRPANLSQRRAVTAMAITAAFAVGTAIAYFLLLPPIETYFNRLQEQQVSLPIWGPWHGLGLFRFHVIFQTGLAFQVPVWVVALRWLEVVRMERLAKLRPYALLVAVVVAALATPTPDIVTMLVVASPLYLLYEAGLLVARLMPSRP